MKIPAALLAALMCLVPAVARAERARTPADGTVFIRVSASVRTIVETGPAGMGRPVDTDVLHVSGSGFVISPLGYVLTNHHVVNPSFEQLVTGTSGVKVTGTVSVAAISVCVPREAVAWPDLVAQPGPDESKCLDASVLAQDEELDLAVLSVSAPNLPYLALGDSDAVAAGETQEALGFPLGARLEIGKERVGADVVPALTQIPGTVTAFRLGCGTSARRGPCVTAGDRNRERRYLQLSNTLHPGNSGGPIVDADGFVIGIVESRAVQANGRVADGIAFAIPANVAKDFLEARGLDSALSVRRLWAGQVHGLDAKRLRVQLPEGWSDIGRQVTRVETDSLPVGIAFRIDRVLSPWSTQRLEEELIGTTTFERGSWTARQSRVTTGQGRAQLRVGRAVGVGPVADDAWMLYGIVDLGTEKLVARYVGSAETLAFNRKVLLDSLASIEGQRFPVPDISALERLTWSSGTDAQGRPAVPIPTGWTSGSEGPAACGGLPLPVGIGSAAAPDDYALRLRTAVWNDAQLLPASAAVACAPTRGSQPGASYSTPFEFLGVRYVADGVFLRVDAGRVVRLEVLAPEARGAAARMVLAAWVRRLVP